MNYEYDITGKLVNPIIIKCDQCGDEFESYYPTTKYCSSKCRNKSRYKDKEVIIKECLVCGKKFETKYIGAKYCSQYCANRRTREFKLTCQTCGKEFTSPSNQTKYCSSKCRKKEVKTYKNICRNCGETFISEKYKKAYCSDECLTEGKREVGKTSYKANGNQYGGVEKREKVFKKKFERRYIQFKYHSGFIDTDSYFNMECRVCGGIQSKSAICMRPWRNKELQCEHCNELLRIRKALIGVMKKKVLEINNQIDKQIKEVVMPEVEALRRISNNHKHYLTCEECGKQYFSRRNRITCSIGCSKKRGNRINEINRRHKLKENGKIHWDITLDKLIDRDNNTCYICGKKCDKGDYILREDGVHISGNNYPSIDHVKPVAKGGTHTWDNVKLAHRGCNSRKSDKRVYVKKSGQLTLAL